MADLQKRDQLIATIFYMHGPALAGAAQLWICTRCLDATSLGG